MKVYVVSSIYPRSGRTTFGTFVRDQSAALHSLGVDARVCNPVPLLPWPIRYLKRYRDKKPDPTFVDALPVERLWWWTLPFSLLETTLRHHCHHGVDRVMKRLFGGQVPDILHAHTLYPVGMVCSRMTRPLGLPLVVTVHGADSRVQLGHPHRRAGVIEAYEAAEKVICVSETIRKDIIRQGLCGDKLVTIHNGVDLSRVYSGPAVAELRRRFGNRPIVLSVAHLRLPSKGIDLTIKAFASICRSGESNDAVLVVVGDGILRSDLEALARGLGIAEKVFFEGNKSPEETMHYMAACDVFSLPSWSEAFGLVYLEAMMHGKPIIAVEGQGISEVVENGRTGMLVPPKDEQAVSGALRLLLKQSQLRTDISQAAEALVQSRFSWERNAQDCMELYSNILSEKKLQKALPARSFD